MTKRDIQLNGGAGFDNDVNTGVSAKLRHFYQSVQEEGIPDRFMSLLERLEKAEQASEHVLAVRMPTNGR